MSAVVLANTDWDFPPELDARPKGKVKQPAKKKFSVRSKPAAKAGAADVILVGGALADANKSIAEHKAPVRTRHMKSIDDLLAHVEDHDVECAIVDQSQPTESRGLKLALLAAANRIKFLVVIADPKNRAEAESIHGVHAVLSAPVSKREVAELAISHVCSASAPEVHPSMKRMARRTNLCGLSSMAAESAESPAGKPERKVRQFKAPTFRHLKPDLKRLRNLQTMPRQIWRDLRKMDNKLAMTALLPMLALCLCFAGLVAFFLGSHSWSVPMQLSANNQSVASTGQQLSVLQTKQDRLNASLVAATSALTAAQTEKQAAEQRLDLARQAVELELGQQTKLLREARAHINRLDAIIAGAGQQNNAAAGMQLESLHQLAVVTNELAMKQIEAERLEARKTYLESLAGQIGQPAARPAPAAGADLAYLGQELAAARKAVAEADKSIAGLTVEASNLSAELETVTSTIKSLRATPSARATIEPMNVVFVPSSNASRYAQGAPLYTCSMLVMFCKEAGKAGEIVEREVETVHPLFGSRVRGVYVEAVLNNGGESRSALLHAGRPPLLF